MSHLLKRLLSDFQDGRSRWGIDRSNVTSWCRGGKNRFNENPRTERDVFKFYVYEFLMNDLAFVSGFDQTFIFV